MRRLNTYSVALLAILASAPFLLSWGVFGHEHINHAAVLCLPEPVQTFFYNHIDFITQESTVPDLRKYTLNDKAEYPRHYADLENYGNYDSLPKNMKELHAKYDEAFLSKNGILPWCINDMMDKLTKAFKEKRKTEMLFLAADLGHYIADAHMPLHTTVNHDGQLTDQKGIHAFWESHLPDLFGSSYNFHCAPAHYIPDVAAQTRNILLASHALVDSLLITDRRLTKKLPAADLYQLTNEGRVLRNKFNQPVHTESYAKAFHNALNGMVEKQLRSAIEQTSCYWYTAWINAGRPDLSALDAKALTEQNKATLKKELELYEKGKLMFLESEKEF